MLIARPRPGMPIPSGQPLTEHTDNVAVKAAEFAKRFHSDLLLRAVGILHDLGKADESWQRYLREAAERAVETGLSHVPKKPAPVKHAAAGAVLALKHYGSFGKILAYLIAGHHAGLPDGKAAMLEKTAPGWNLDDWQREGEKNLAALGPLVDQVRKQLPELPATILPAFIRGNSDHVAQAFFFWIRMLFSCLVDADCLDAEAVADPDKAAKRENRVTFAELQQRLTDHLATFRTPEPGTVNAARAEVLAACRDAATLDPNVFSLTVPTGGGKTLSAMAFALDHALKHGKRRVIHVIPYTSIIEQTADVFSDIFGKENVCEHHSGITPEKNGDGEPSASRLAADNWDAPIVVTTSVQFFESLYASRGSKCRKLHNLADSVIVLDEAQLLPVELLAPCVEALRQLVHGYGVTLVLATATQPALPGLDAREIVPDPDDLFSRLRRTRFVWPTNERETTSWSALAERLRAHESFLCIVNTRKDAYDLWTELGGDVFHLSTLMCPQHRRDVLATIRRRLAAGEPTRVVSTQLVEAGVDVDFPVVYRAMAGMDSLAQAAGRCNREGRANGVADVHIFIPEKQALPGIIGKATDETLGLFRTRGSEELETHGIFREYFHNLYGVANSRAEDMLQSIAKDAQTLMFPFRSIADRFRLIDEDTVPIVIDYGEGREIIEQIRKRGVDRDTMRRAQRFIVSPFRPVVERLDREGRIEAIADGLYAVTEKIGRYDTSTGLDVWNSDIPPECLTVCG